MIILIIELIVIWLHPQHRSTPQDPNPSIPCYPWSVLLEYAFCNYKQHVPYSILSNIAVLLDVLLHSFHTGLLKMASYVSMVMGITLREQT
jgi:hypothetical protein